MVRLALLPAKGTPSSRYFPHSGYLGLSPVKVQGVVRVSLDEDGKLLQASDVSVSVRCYEARVGRSGIIRSNVLADSSVQLWSNTSGREWDALGNMDLPFKIVLPPSIGGYSTLSLPDYRIFWKVQAVINHAHQFGIGSRTIKSYDLRLTRYDVQPIPLPDRQHAILCPNKHGEPSFQYSVSTPNIPYGPDDIIHVELSVKPIDPSVRIHSTNLLLERRLHLLETSPVTPPPLLSINPDYLSCDSISSPPSPVSDSAENLVYTSSNNSSATWSVSTLDTGASISEVPLLGNKRSPGTPVSSGGSSTVPAKMVATAVATTQSAMMSTHEGLQKKQIAFHVPSPKSSSFWAHGFTMDTSLVSQRFFLRVQLVVSSQHATQEVIELQERELHVVPTNDSERSVASEKMESWSSSSSRSKSKSPSSYTNRHRRREDSESSTPPTSSCSATAGGGRSPTIKTSKSRRPHTSSGMRDASRGAFQTSSTRTSPAPSPIPPATTSARSSLRFPLVTGTLLSTNAFDVVPVPNECFKDWEDELDRIEQQSRIASRKYGITSTRRTAVQMMFGERYHGQRQPVRAA